MNKLYPLVVAAASLGLSVVPSFAATSIQPVAPAAATSPYCDFTERDVRHSTDNLTARLEAKGYSVDRLDSQGGCLQAFVTDKSGQSHILLLDPVYLNPVGSANG
jgi:hypothetical protein